MYGILRQVARDERISGLIEDLSGMRVPVQGVHVGMDEIYAGWLHEKVETPWIQWDSESARRLNPGRRTEPVEEKPRVPEWWRGHAARAGYGENAEPFFVRVILRPDSGDARQWNLPHRLGGLRVVYETRPRAVALALTHGDRVSEPGSTQHGTCGGFLQDFNTGTKYGVTCDHVLSGQTSVESGSATVGQHAASGTLTPKPKHGNCNSRSMPGAATADWAVFELHASISTNSGGCQYGRVAHVEPVAGISQYLNVEFEGATSGLVKCRTGCLCVWHEIDIDGTAHCFSDLMELRWRPLQLLKNLTHADLALGGDSGAWVIAPLVTVGATWLGMVIAGDGMQAYACFAETVVQRAHSSLSNSQLGLMI